MADQEGPGGKEPLPDPGYTAFEKWEHRPTIYRLDHDQSWIDMGESFYRASVALIEGVVNGGLYEDIEGIAGVYLFRHYLELVLKRIVLRGRSLLREDENTPGNEIKQVANIHELSVLWDWVLQDSKPKIPEGDWSGWDISFVEKCVAEFDTVDQKGFAFRYPRQGGENCRFDYPWLLHTMNHVQQVLDGILTYLIEMHAQNAEWDSYLEAEYGSDMYY